MKRQAMWLTGLAIATACFMFLPSLVYGAGFLLGRFRHDYGETMLLFQLLQVCWFMVCLALEMINTFVLCRRSG